jgi:hypothetical protein
VWKQDRHREVNPLELIDEPPSAVVDLFPSWLAAARLAVMLFFVSVNQVLVRL